MTDSTTGAAAMALPQNSNALARQVAIYRRFAQSLLWVLERQYYPCHAMNAWVLGQGAPSHDQNINARYQEAEAMNSQQPDLAIRMVVRQFTPLFTQRCGSSRIAMESCREPAFISTR